MAREVIIKVWCDVCMTDDVHTEARELAPVHLPEVGHKPRVVALCEPHRKEFYEPLVDLLRDFGQVVDDPARKAAVKAQASPNKTRTSEVVTADPKDPDRPFGCPACDYTGGSRSQLDSHARSKHDATVADLTGTAAFTCPECGKGFSVAQGCGAHRARVHGVKGAKSKPAKRASSQQEETLIEVPAASDDTGPAEDKPKRRRARKVA